MTIDYMLLEGVMIQEIRGEYYILDSMRTLFKTISQIFIWMSVWSWILSFGMNTCFIQFLISISSQLMQFQIELFPTIQSKLSIYSLIMNSFESTLIAYEGWYVLKDVCCRKTNPI